MRPRVGLLSFLSGQVFKNKNALQQDANRPLQWPSRGGGSLSGGGGVGCLPRGCLPRVCLPRVCLPRVCLPRGVST